MAVFCYAAYEDFLSIAKDALSLATEKISNVANPFKKACGAGVDVIRQHGSDLADASPTYFDKEKFTLLSHFLRLKGELLFVNLIVS